MTLAWLLIADDNSGRISCLETSGLEEGGLKTFEGCGKGIRVRGTAVDCEGRAIDAWIFETIRLCFYILFQRISQKVFGIRMRSAAGFSEPEFGFLD